MVRTLSQGGALHQIWPGPVEEMPDDLARATQHALTIIKWQENLMEDDMPPAWAWGEDEFLNGWFAEVRSRRSNTTPKFEIDGPFVENEMVRR